MARKADAPAVSRVLRKAGFVVTSTHTQEGVRVRGGFLGVMVVAQVDGTLAAYRVAAAAADALREAGYTVENLGAGLRVSKVSPQVS